MSTKPNNEAIIQNLKDAGCSDEMIQEFLKYQETECCCGMLCLLGKQRAKILGRIHKEQFKLDCLDFLMRKIKKEKNEKK